MKVKFANGVVKNCMAPMEQKIFKNSNGEAIGVGWLLILKLTGNITSSELDGMLIEDNVKSLEFLTENETGEDIVLFNLDEYSKISASTIRHAENTSATYAEIQLSKGV